MSNDIVPAPIYQSLTPAQVDVATRAEERIKSRTVLTVIENGLDLIEVKEALGHGHFTTWVEQAFGGEITIRTAQRWMNAAVEYGSKSEVTSLLGREVLLLLSAPSMPEEIRTLVEIRALAGDKITVAEVQELKREAARASLAWSEPFSTKTRRNHAVARCRLAAIRHLPFSSSNPLLHCRRAWRKIMRPCGDVCRLCCVSKFGRLNA